MIVRAEGGDWGAFMGLARAEGWRVPENEIEFHRQGGSRAWAQRRDDVTIGLVSGVLHRRSAWIGNLIVAPSERGHGFGAALFDHAVKELRAAGAETLWLTASALGAPLYAARGFITVGQIERWVRRRGGSGDGALPSPRVNGALLDSEIWDDDRSALLRHLEKSGRWHQQGGSLALLQRSADLQIIGPWYGSKDEGDDLLLLARLLAAAAPQVELVVDLVGGCGRGKTLTAAGFAQIGSTGLMLAGSARIDWARLLSLATLGSCG